MRIEIISGSARKASQTKRVALHLLRQLMSHEDVYVGLIDLFEYSLPPVNDVFESPDDAPYELREIAERLVLADAFILVTPEYNGSYSPAMKNFLDHFPKQYKKTFGIVSASPGSLGGIRAAIQLQSLTYGLMGVGSPQMLIVPDVNKKFSPDGTLVDHTLQPSIASFLENFLWLGHAVSYARVKSVVKTCA